MALSEKDVLYVAKLARLEVADSEVAKYTQQLGNILGLCRAIEQARHLQRGTPDPSPGR